LEVGIVGKDVCRCFPTRVLGIADGDATNPTKSRYCPLYLGIIAGPLTRKNLSKPENYGDEEVRTFSHLAIFDFVRSSVGNLNPWAKPIRIQE
jgi:hypothetical protein